MTNPYAASEVDLSGATATGDATYEPQVFAVNGRIGRLRYLAYSYFSMFAVGIAFGIAGGLLGAILKSPIVAGVIAVLAYVPIVALTFIFAKRRLNDLDKSGWMSLLFLVPIVNFVFPFYLMFAPGASGPNRFGPAPEKNSTLVVIGGLVLPIVFTVGILAAVALPAYQAYTMKAKAAAMQQTP